MPSLRLFIAVNFSDEIIINIMKFIQEAQHLFSAGKLRWVRSENIHLTLKFLGNVPSEKTDKLIQAINQTATCSNTSLVTITGLGAYPSLNKPQVIWLGVKADRNLLDLHKNLNLNLKAAGLSEEEKIFRPHITLARVSNKTSLQERNLIAIKLKTLDIPTIGVTKLEIINLFMSELSPAGPIYTEIHSAALKQEI